MSPVQNSLSSTAALTSEIAAPPKLAYSLVPLVTALSLCWALAFHKSYGLSWLGDMLQNILLASFVVLSFRNVVRSRGQVRTFWRMIFLGAAIWLSSQMVWSVYELGLRLAVPDSPLADFLLIAKLVPLSAAAVLAPQKKQDSRFRTFGLLDLSILILYSLYLFAFFVYAYRLLPAALTLYNARFNFADSIGNLIFASLAGIAFFRERGPWRSVYLPLFFASVCYGAASTWNDVAIDQGLYYTGSLYDVPLIAGMGAFIWVCLSGRPLLHSSEAVSDSVANASDRKTPRFRFLSSHLAMLVTFSTPA